MFRFSHLLSANKYQFKENYRNQTIKSTVDQELAKTGLPIKYLDFSLLYSNQLFSNFFF